MFKKGLLALALVFSLPVFAAEHWIDVRVPEQYQQEHVQGAINIPLKEVKERIATAVPDKNDTVKVYCNAGRQSGQAKEILSEMGYTHVENAGGLKDIAMSKVKRIHHERRLCAVFFSVTPYLHPHRLFASAHKYAFSLVKNDFLRD